MKKTKKYPFYSEKPDISKLKTVTTINGDTEYRVNCVKYPDGYYTKEKDLIFFKETGKWTKKSNLFYDHELKEWFKKRNNMLEGVVAVKNNTVHVGLFSENPYKNCTVVTRHFGTIPCMDYELLTDDLFIENKCEGVYYEKSILSPAQIKSFSEKRVGVNNNRNVYNVVDDLNSFKRSIDLFENNKFKIDSDLRFTAKFLGDLSFGIEMETVSGYLPQHLLNQYGIIICRDGSLRNEDGLYPPEYTTVPYKGSKGLQAIRNITKEIAERSAINEKCSLHVHVGGFKVDRLFMVSLYNLCEKLQDEIFTMFPFYKTDEVRYANKEKNYCQKLPSIFRRFGSGFFKNYIDDAYENMYSFITKQKFNRTNNAANRRNPFGNNKWDIPTRYYWVNFTNIFFGKQDTVEFRIHTPTLNGDKIINWMFLCSAIVQYAIKNPKKCVGSNNVTLNDVIDSLIENTKSKYGVNLVEKLKEYCTIRKNIFLADKNKGDYMSRSYIDNDSNFTFNITKV